MEVSDENRFEESRASDKPQRTFEQTNYDGNLHSSVRLRVFVWDIL